MIYLILTMNSLFFVDMWKATGQGNIYGLGLNGCGD